MRAAVIVALLSLAAPALAQPASDEKARAKELYLSAEAAMKALDYAGAIRDYGAAYEITHDPALFYKIGSANERAGKCPVAVIYFKRYLAEGKPTPAFADITNARIKACQPAGAAQEPTTEPPPPEPPKPELPKTEPPTTEPPKTEPPKPEPTEQPKTSMGGFVGNGPKDSAKGPSLSARNRPAWLFVAGSIALVTVGAVLAYSAESAENDVSDLYVGLGGRPPAFDRETKVIYDEMIEEGRRFERLSWVSFGLAGATAGAAAYLFWRERDTGEPVTVTPTVTKDGAGVSAQLRF